MSASPLQVRTEKTEQISVSPPLGNIDWAFPPDVLQGSPSAQADQPLDQLRRRATESSLVQWGIHEDPPGRVVLINS